MQYLRLAQISQVKTSSLIDDNALHLFRRFRLGQILRQCKIDKVKGHPIEYMLHLMLIIILLQIEFFVFWDTQTPGKQPKESS